MVITYFQDGKHKHAIKAEVIAMVNIDGKIIPSQDKSLLRSVCGGRDLRVCLTVTGWFVKYKG